MIRKIKVFLVEDEVIIRSGVKKSINWEQEGYEFVGEASDGELAYPMILKEKPDILITDIRMPFMDGLELSRLVKKELPDIKILILSGYDEFEYAKKAIKIGVTEYLLKPISAAKLTEVLNAVAETIRQENEEKNLLETYFAEMRENTERDKMRLFEKLLMGDLSMGEILEAGERFGMNLGASCYKIVLFKILANLENHVYAEQMVDACSSVEQAASMMEGVYVFQRGVEGWAFLLTAQDEKSMEESAKILYQNLKQAMKNYTQLEYFGGIGSTVPRIRSLKQSFREADRAFAARFVEEANQIISQKEFEKSQMEEGLKMQGVVQIGKPREMLQKFLSNGTREEVKAFSDAYISRIEEENIRSTMVRQYVVIDVCIVILSFCERISSANRLQEEAEELQKMMQKIHSLSEIKKYVVRLLNEAIELRDAESGRRYSDLIAAAKKEIENHYMTEEISLNTVAISVGMSPSYFSSIFSKEAGKTFVEYLTEVRIEKAKEFLMCSSMKTSEIGYEVGYKDPHYFSYIFKKVQGCSPKEYRARGKE
ncbi:response regulator receiver domain protein [[Clostridium] nexile DSM 1787]|nr:response regulator receiver domain protein [[Clostridium] nexile DSM 1787]